jgi:hypothetical protein
MWSQDNAKNFAAYLISRIFGPATALIVIWLVTAFKSGIGFWKALWVYSLIFFVDLAIPLLITSYLVYTKRVKDIEWRDVNQRNKFLIPLGCATIPILLVLTYLLTNAVIFHLSLLFSAIMIAIFAIYKIFKFKVSLHIALTSLAINNVCLFFGIKFLWLNVLLIPIFWARRTLKAHTISEMIAGFILPNVIILMAIAIFGWPNV